MGNKIVRSVCCFTDGSANEAEKRVNELAQRLGEQGFEIQTRRICTPYRDPKEFYDSVEDKEILLGVGSISFGQAIGDLPRFYQAPEVSFNINLSQTDIDEDHTKILFDIIKNAPSATFNFTYVFNNPSSSPYFPAANYEKEGFAIGLQPTDLSENCNTLEEWLSKTKEVWDEISQLFENEQDFLGIDSSIAPVFDGKGSLVNFIKRLGMSFNDSVTTDTYTKITKFMETQNQKPVGLCGLMFPCLEDFELADQYEQGNFSIERNLFLSLHSGLGIDTYPIGTDEEQERVAQILRLVQSLSNKYKKPLSARFVSDGKAKIGEKTDFQNQYLKDVVVKKL